MTSTLSQATSGRHDRSTRSTLAFVCEKAPVRKNPARPAAMVTSYRCERLAVSPVASFRQRRITLMARIHTAYILSSGHSGSTLLNLLLGGHPAIVPVGEITHLPKNLALDTLCSCGTPARSCDFWQPIVAQFGQRIGRDLSSDPYAMRLGFIGATRVVDRKVMTPGYRRAWKVRHGAAFLRARTGLTPLPPLLVRFDEGCRNTLALFETVRAITGAQVVVDASKDYLKGLGLYRLDPKGTRLILLTRDGRGVFYSGVRSGLSREDALRRWLNYYSRALPLIARNVQPDDVLRVRYEDLATATAATLQRVCAFLQLPYDPTMLELDARPAHITNGNGMRLRGDRKIALDQSWRSNLGPADMAYFERHAGVLNAELGHGDTDPAASIPPSGAKRPL
jgi:Sulfotransferase family